MFTFIKQIFNLIFTIIFLPFTWVSRLYLTASSLKIHGSKYENCEKKDSHTVSKYYDIATSFFEFGWGDKFHFAPLDKNKSFQQSLTEHETFLFSQLNKDKYDNTITYLDCGCGVGGPARTMLKTTLNNVVGITINRYQIERANFLTSQLPFYIQNRVKFQYADFNNMPFQDKTFDGVYSIEATVHSEDIKKTYAEIFRVLKNDAYYVTYEWLTTENFDSSNKEHIDAVNMIKFGNGLPVIRNCNDIITAAEIVGFQTVREFDLAKTGDKHWVTELTDKINIVNITTILLYVLEKLKIVQKGSFQAHEVMKVALKGLIKGSELNIFTPMHLFVFYKK